MEERGCVVYQLFHGSVSERLRWPWTCPRRDCTETTTSLPITATCYFPGLIWYVRWRECECACVRQCVFTLARRAITAGRVNLTDPILPHSLHSDCVRTTSNGLYYVWPADLSMFGCCSYCWCRHVCWGFSQWRILRGAIDYPKGGGSDPGGRHSRKTKNLFLINIFVSISVCFCL